MFFLVTCLITTVNISESFYKKAVVIEAHISQVELEIQRPAISVCNRHCYQNMSAYRYVVFKASDYITKCYEAIRILY